MTDPHPLHRWRVPPGDVRWRCPRGWTAPIPRPSGPRLLWGQDRLTSGLTLAALQAGTPAAQHVEVTAPSRPDVIAAIADHLRAAGATPVVWATRAAELDLRGRADRPGRLADADGGVLIVDAHDVPGDSDGWGALREAMSLGTVRRLPPEEQEQHPAGGDQGHDAERDGEPTSPLDLDPDPARCTVVLVGLDSVLRKLRDADPRAAQLLRHRLELASDRPRTRDGVSAGLAALRAAVDDRGLGPISPGACGLAAELLAVPARRGFVSTDDRAILDAIADARARRPNGLLDRRPVRAAWLARRDRHAAREEAHRRRVVTGQLLIETTGAHLGVVNGLMVYGQNRLAYAMPGRITASVAVGREGLINVEREAKYSGRSFDKGVFQLAGLLRGLYATTAPLGLAATLTFEQSYGRVDGDSATLAEAIAVFSCLAGLPARQDVAVSGAINPRGEVLPVGSATLKVEGWYRTCLATGLTGEQGVLLPTRSVPDLQVDEEVLAAIEAGRFHVWAVDTVDDALEALLGRPAGRRPGKPFAAQSVYGRAGKTMRRMSERLYPPRKPSTKASAKKKEKAAPGPHKPTD